MAARNLYYNPPESLYEAENRVCELETAIARIQFQLDFSDQAEEDPSWKVRATDSKLYKEQELRQIKLWITQHQRQMKMIQDGQLILGSSPTAESILIKLVSEFSSKKSSLTRDQRLVLTAAQAWIDANLDVVSLASSV